MAFAGISRGLAFLSLALIFYSAFAQALYIPGKDITGKDYAAHQVANEKDNGETWYGKTPNGGTLLILGKSIEDLGFDWNTHLGADQPRIIPVKGKLPDKLPRAPAAARSFDPTAVTDARYEDEQSLALRTLSKRDQCLYPKGSVREAVGSCMAFLRVYEEEVFETKGTDLICDYSGPKSGPKEEFRLTINTENPETKKATATGDDILDALNWIKNNCANCIDMKYGCWMGGIRMASDDRLIIVADGNKKEDSSNAKRDDKEDGKDVLQTVAGDEKEQVQETVEQEPTTLTLVNAPNHPTDLPVSDRVYTYTPSATHRRVHPTAVPGPMMPKQPQPLFRPSIPEVATTLASPPKSSDWPPPPEGGEDEGNPDVDPDWDDLRPDEDHDDEKPPGEDEEGEEKYPETAHQKPHDKGDDPDEVHEKPDGEDDANDDGSNDRAPSSRPHLMPPLHIPSPDKCYSFSGIRVPCGNDPQGTQHSQHSTPPVALRSRAMAEETDDEGRTVVDGLRMVFGPDGLPLSSFNLTTADLKEGIARRDANVDAHDSPSTSDIPATATATSHTAQPPVPTGGGVLGPQAKHDCHTNRGEATYRGAEYCHGWLAKQAEDPATMMSWFVSRGEEVELCSVWDGTEGDKEVFKVWATTRREGEPEMITAVMAAAAMVNLMENCAECVGEVCRIGGTLDFGGMKTLDLHIGVPGEKTGDEGSRPEPTPEPQPENEPPRAPSPAPEDKPFVTSTKPEDEETN